MNQRKPRLPLLLSLLMTIGLLTFWPGKISAQEQQKFKTGLDFDYLMRTISWDDEEGQPKLKGYMISVREDIRLGKNTRLALKAGLSFSSFRGLIFRNLPISLEYGAGAVESLALGAEFRTRLFGSGEFEIEGVGRIVSSLGFTKTWPLEGFAVEGEARGRPSWFEASIGPRITYIFFGRFRPYLFVSGNYLRGEFKMDETLEDLTGTETITFKGKSIVGVAFGAAFEANSRLTLNAEAGFLPYQGGVDGRFNLGFSYAF